MGRQVAYLVLALVLCWTTRARAAFNDIITGARPQGMGGAFVAVADDANALYWNPAGLTQLDSAEVTFMHANEFDVSVGPALLTDFVGFVNWPMQFGTIGVSGFQQGNSRILQERSLVLSYAKDVSPASSMGLNVKYLELDPSGIQVNPGDPALQTQGTFSFDLAGLYTVTPYWKLGYLVRNILGTFGAAEREELRKTYRFGSAYRFEELMFHSDSLIWSLDLFTRDDVADRAGTKVRASSGIEYAIDERFAVRLGVNAGHFAAGLGLGHPETGIFIDYAFANDEPGTTHRISATYRFGGPPGEVHVVHHREKKVYHHVHDEPPKDLPLPPEPPPKKRQVEGTLPAKMRTSSPVSPTPAALAKSGTWRTQEARLAAPPVRQEPKRKASQEYDRELEDFLEK